MSGEDETFDIDLYGDEDDTQQYDGAEDPQSTAQSTKHKSLDGTQSLSKNASATDNNETNKTNGTATPTAQGVKRKAPDDEYEQAESVQHDERPLDQGAQPSLKLTELQWWTTEEDLRYFCAQSHTEAELVEVAFGEHKINGKSRGEAYLGFKTPQAAGMVKREIEKANAELDAGGKVSVAGGKSKISVWYTSPGNPFKVREGQGKKEVSNGKQGQQGAYNSYNNHSRGGYTGSRGRGGYNARGGGQWSGQNSNLSANTNTNSFNNSNNMMPGYGNMGFSGFPAMAMNPTAMMSNMMAGGFNLGAMGMGMPGMMGARGGGNMVSNRGGWNAGMNQGHQQGGYGAGWDSNKKSRKE